MLNVQLQIHKEGIVLGLSSETGTPWAEYYLAGKLSDKVEAMICKVIEKAEPIRGDAGTMAEWAKWKKRTKGKKK